MRGRLPVSPPIACTSASAPVKTVRVPRARSIAALCFRKKSASPFRLFGLSCCKKAEAPEGASIYQLLVDVYAKRGAVVRVRRIPPFATSTTTNIAREKVCVSISYTARYRQ